MLFRCFNLARQCFDLLYDFVVENGSIIWNYLRRHLIDLHLFLWLFVTLRSRHKQLFYYHRQNTPVSPPVQFLHIRTKWWGLQNTSIPIIRGMAGVMQRNSKGGSNQSFLQITGEKSALLISTHWLWATIGINWIEWTVIEIIRPNCDHLFKYVVAWKKIAYYPKTLYISKPETHCVAIIKFI